EGVLQSAFVAFVENPVDLLGGGPGLDLGNQDDLAAHFVEEFVEGDGGGFLSAGRVLDRGRVPFLPAEVPDGSGHAVEGAVCGVVVDEDGGAVFEELDVHFGEESVLRRGGEAFHGFFRIDVGAASVGDRVRGGIVVCCR